MAKKQFDDYYKRMEENYLACIIQSKTFVELLEQGKIDEERVINFKSSIEPVINTYQIMRKVKQLLDKPVRKEKHKKYLNMLEKKNKNDNQKYNLESLEQESLQALEKLKDLTE